MSVREFKKPETTNILLNLQNTMEILLDVKDYRFTGGDFPTLTITKSNGKTKIVNGMAFESLDELDEGEVSKWRDLITHAEDDFDEEEEEKRQVRKTKNKRIH